MGVEEGGDAGGYQGGFTFTHTERDVPLEELPAGLRDRIAEQLGVAAGQGGDAALPGGVAEGFAVLAVALLGRVAALSWEMRPGAV